jgi:hypothetical protein
MTTISTICVTALGIFLIYLYFLPLQFEEVMPNWLDRTRFMCATSESQAEKDFWCN